MKNHINATSHEDSIARVESARHPKMQRLYEIVREEAPDLAPTMAFTMLGYGAYHSRYAGGRELIREVVRICTND